MESVINYVMVLYDVLLCRNPFPVAVLAQFQRCPSLGQWPVSCHHQHLLLPVRQRSGHLHLLHVPGQEAEDQHGEGGRRGNGFRVGGGEGGY